MTNLSPGSVFADHRIEGVAGQGGMGIVYRATHLELEVPRALKLIAEDLADDEGFRQRFKRESRLAASIRHPHVIPIHHAGEENGRLFIAMDYVDGSDLRALIAREGRLEPRRAARIVSEVARALDAAHARGLVHRDIKPANVLVALDNGHEHCYLSDFGLTKNLSSKSGMTKTGMFVGTVDYMAPEQIQGAPLDARTDVYALGCVFYEALSGEVPFPRDSDLPKIYAHLSDPPPRLIDSVPGLPSELADVIERAMAKDRDERYPSAGDLGKAALAAAEGETVTDEERTVARGEAAPRPDAPPPGPPIGVPPLSTAPEHAAAAGETVTTPEPLRPAPPDQRLKLHPPPVRQDGYGGPVAFPVQQPPEPGPVSAYAGWGQRLVAALIDGLIIGVGGSVIALPLAAAAATDPLADFGDLFLGLWIIIGGPLAAFLYPALAMRRPGAHNGQTVGKQALGIRVALASRQPMTFWRGVLRDFVLKYLLFGVVGALTLYILTLLNYLWPLWDSQKQALHDKMGSSYVIRA